MSTAGTAYPAYTIRSARFIASAKVGAFSLSGGIAAEEQYGNSSKR
jgi:hypothetical protein